jgi:hypothetical protein
VPYQRIWFDFDVPDGSYTPEELQRANKVVKRGALQSYTLRWPLYQQRCHHE